MYFKWDIIATDNLEIRVVQVEEYTISIKENGKQEKFVEYFIAFQKDKLIYYALARLNDEFKND